MVCSVADDYQADSNNTSTDRNMHFVFTDMSFHTKSNLQKKGGANRIIKHNIVRIVEY